MICMIVEDSRPARNIIKSYVNEIKLSQKFIFLEAGSGEEALKMLQREHVDFVLLDWNLSTEMTGFDVLKAIRLMEKFKKLPVIMVTSEGDKQNVIGSLKHGANDFIIKPIDKKLLTEKILKVLNEN